MNVCRVCAALLGASCSAMVSYEDDVVLFVDVRFKFCIFKIFVFIFFLQDDGKHIQIIKRPTI